MLFLIGDMETQSSLYSLPSGWPDLVPSFLPACLSLSFPCLEWHVQQQWGTQIQVLTWILNIICPAMERQKRRVSATDTSRKCVSDRGWLPLHSWPSWVTLNTGLLNWISQGKQCVHVTTGLRRALLVVKGTWIMVKLMVKEY